MRVCIVNPPSPFLLDERVFMPLGAIKVVTQLRARGVHAWLLDLSGRADYLDVFSDMLDSECPTHVGFSATTPQLPSVTAMARLVPAPDRCRTILGGPHVTLVHAAAKRELARGRAERALEEEGGLLAEFDVLVAGDGEEAVFVALHMERGLVDADDPKSSLHLKAADLANYPVPDRSLVDVNSYRFFIEGVRSLSLIAQLGCPFGCGFCGGRLSSTYRNIRQRAHAHAVTELAGLYDRYGITGFMFVDDEINVSKEMPGMMRGLAQAAKDRGVRWTLRAHAKAELLTDEQAQLMADAGFVSVFVGFESGHDRILRNINKNATLAENTRCVEIARRAGLKVKALMSVGHPGESAETIRATRDWLLAVKPDDIGVSVITTYPGTPYYDDAVRTDQGWCYTAKSGDTLYAEGMDYTREAAYYKGMRGAYRSFVHTDALSAEELVRERDALESEVREALRLPWPTATQQTYEQSMGQAVV